MTNNDKPFFSREGSGFEYFANAVMGGFVVLLKNYKYDYTTKFPKHSVIT